jgi:hypothetical protein
MKANPLAINAKDAQLIEARTFEIRDVANILGVPPHKLGDTTRTAYASLEQENWSYLSEALDGWLSQIEDECTEKLLSTDEQESESHTIEFMRQAIVRIDMKSRFEAYNVARNGGWMSANDIRNKENENEIEGGDEYWRPQNMAVVGQKPAEMPVNQPISVPKTPANEPEEEPQGDENQPDGGGNSRQQRIMAAHRALLVNVLRRMVTITTNEAKRAAKHPEKFVGWLDADMKRHEKVFIEAVGPAIEAISAVTGETVTTAAELSAEYYDTVREQLLTVCECKPVELAEQVETWTRGHANAPEALADEVIAAEWRIARA